MREKAKGKGEAEKNVVAIRGGSVGTPDSEEGKQADCWLTLSSQHCKVIGVKSYSRVEGNNFSLSRWSNRTMWQEATQFRFFLQTYSKQNKPLSV